MAGGGGQQQQGGADNSMGFLWITIALFIAVLVIWYVWHAQIVAFVFQIKLFEIAIVSLFSTGLDSLKQAIQSTPTTNITIMQLGAVSELVGKFIRFPLAGILVVLSFLLFRTSAANNFRKVYTMKTLQKQEEENWPQIHPTVNLDLANEHIEQGKWAMAMTPLQFAKQHKLIKEEMKAREEGELRKTQRILPVVIQSKANSVFVQQLGQPWTGVQALKKHERAFFAIFAAKANGDREVTQKILWQMAASSTGRLNFSGVDQLIKKHADTKLVKEIISRHAYTYTVMASMLELARCDGVLASAEFIWLKPYDRHLWFILNTVGRQTAPPEVAGVYAHWIAEKAVGRRMVIPMVAEATNALQVALNELIYKPDEKEIN